MYYNNYKGYSVSDHTLAMLQIMCLPVAGVRGDDIMCSLCSSTLLVSLDPGSSCLTATAGAVEQVNHIITAVS